MRGLLVAGIVLIVLGIAGLVVNPLTINSDKETDYIIPNYVGIIAIVAGVGLAVAGTRKS